MIKNIINRIINFFGYKLIGNKKIVKHNDFDSIIYFILSNFEKKNKFVFFDVGANTGQSIDRFLNHNDQTLIHSFEPTPELFKILETKYSNRISKRQIFINKFGLGNTANEMDFYSFNYNQINSFIPIEKNSKFERSRKLAVGKNSIEFEKKIKAKVSTLDIYCRENNINNIDFIKIDTQGYEPEVLGGAYEMLLNQKIKIIEIELILGFAYEKRLSFFDLENKLQPHGYKLISISNSGNVIAYSNFQVDLLYVRNDIFENLKFLHKDNTEIKNVMNAVSEEHPYSY